jgi:hypothetical protein
MTPTTCHMSISLDGFVAGPDQSRENPLGVGAYEYRSNATIIAGSYAGRPHPSSR